jgi:hypothetical protein
LSSTSGTGRVYLSCTTTAPKAACSINSGDTLNQYTVDFSKSASGAATVNVTTTSNTAGSNVLTHGFDNRIFLASALALFAAVLVPTTRTRKLRRSLGGAGLMFALLVPGCGSGHGNSPSPVGGNGTPPGNYSVTVNAYTVGNTSGNPDSLVSIPLTVN